MSSIIRKAMWPAALVGALAVFFGALGSAGINTPSAADARPGDICAVEVDKRAVKSTDGQGNDVYVIEKGKAYGIVFFVENAEGNWSDDSEISEARRRGRGNSDDYKAGPDIWVAIDSETGSGKITSAAEIASVDHEFEERDRWRGGPNSSGRSRGGDWLYSVENVWHKLVNFDAGTTKQLVDTIHPDFNDADGYPAASIGSWLHSEGYRDFTSTDANCSTGVDTWGFVDIQCDQHGYFYLNIGHAGYSTNNVGKYIKFYCPGERYAETADLTIQRSILETQPTGVAPHGFGTSLVTVTVYDRDGKNLDGAKVTFITDNCRFENTDPAGDNPISPVGQSAGEPKTVVTYSDTDTAADTNFTTNNPGQTDAGTAEVVLNCVAPNGQPGKANITAIVERQGADIVLKGEVQVIGPTAATGLTVVVTPDDNFKCGEPVLATATAVDVNGNPVSNGTVIYFTTITSSGVVGGHEGAQGQAPTVGGTASVHIATDPTSDGVHTVIASVKNAAGGVTAQAYDTYKCDGPKPQVVAPAPTHTAPGTGTGTGSITPPNTGSAGLAAGTSSSLFLVLAGAVAFVVAGLASIRFARQS